MVGPGKGLAKKPVFSKSPRKGVTKKPTFIASIKNVPQPSPRRSAKLTPCKTETVFQHMDKEEIGGACSSPTKSTQLRRSARLTPCKTLTGFQLTDEEEIGSARVSERRITQPLIETSDNMPFTPIMNVRKRTEVRRLLDLVSTPVNDKDLRTPSSSHQSHEVMNEHSQAIEEHDASEGSSKRRGFTRNIGSANRRNPNEPMNFEINVDAGRIVGQSSQHIITEVGCVMQQNAILDGRSWKQQPEEVKDHIIKKAIKRSKRNKENRAKSTIYSTVGSKSIARTIHEAVMEGREVSAIDAYEFSHYSKKRGKMANDKAAEILESMREMEAIMTKTSVEICQEMLNGTIPGHIKGSAAPKKTVASEKLRVEVSNERKKVEEAEAKAEEMMTELAALKHQQAQTNAKMDLMMEHLARLSGHEKS